MKLLQSGLLTPKNVDRIARVFYDATKIVYERQKRLGKPQLKMKEISSAFLLAERIYSPQLLHFDATGDLAGNFGHFDEASALRYYEEYVMGEVTDKLGRQVKIDEDGMKSLYKEPLTGRHIVSSGNYEEGRGKRLPWIRHILSKAESIFVVEETVHGAFRRSFLYLAVVSIPLGTKAQTTYHVVIVREGKNAVLKLVTAYSVFNRNRFLSVIEPTRPVR